jgi:hypothetical protein
MATHALGELLVVSGVEVGAEVHEGGGIGLEGSQKPEEAPGGIQKERVCY